MAEERRTGTCQGGQLDLSQLRSESRRVEIDLTAGVICGPRTGVPASRSQLSAMRQGRLRGQQAPHLGHKLFEQLSGQAFAHTDVHVRTAMSQRMPGHELSCQLRKSRSWIVCVGWPRQSAEYLELVPSLLAWDTGTHSRFGARDRTTSAGHPVSRVPVSLV
jgi:hypothetical protein